MHITLGAQGIAVDGEPVLVQAGALHYFRLPHPDLWEPVLLRMRMAGLNAVTVPLPWTYHSPAAGLYDFTGPRDLRCLFDSVAEAGLWLIPEVGPWIDAGLDTGGIPPWLARLSGALPDCIHDEVAGPSFPFLRQVREWWARLFPFFLTSPNLLLLALDPGACGDAPLRRYARPLAALARELGLSVPCVVSLPEAGTRRWFPVTEEAGVAERDLGIITLPGNAQALATIAHSRANGYVLAPGHAGLDWGYWGGRSPGEIEAPVAEGPGLDAAYFRARQMAYALETLADVVLAEPPDPRVYASDAAALLATRAADAGTVAFLAPGGAADAAPRLSLAGGDEMLTSEPMAGDGPRVLPLDWPLAGGRLILTTMSPVLTITVAGRHLLVVANESGGDLMLSDDFRLRHARGPVRAQRTGGRLAARFEAGRVVSLLLDGPDGPLQVLALAPRFAARVWPLDDSWRNTPAYPARWHPLPEDPARGLVIGPDLVSPRADGDYEYLVREKGYGYRWGPWRGSDPQTWLAPLTWRGTEPVPVPPLTWRVQPGAPEVLPDYDAVDWPQVARGAPLSMVAHGIPRGFAWYRGAFAGTAREVTLRCDDTADLFFNGELIATLNAPPDGRSTPPKTLPLPARLLREQNVLALLVERQPGGAGWTGWEEVARPHGLLDCALDSGAPIHWRIRAGLSGERNWQGVTGYAEWPLVPDVGAAYVTWHRAQFALGWPDAVEATLSLVLERVQGRVYVFYNGMLVGRGQDIHETWRLWLPEGLSRRQGTNELLIAQWVRGGEPGLGAAYLDVGPTFRWYS